MESNNLYFSLASSQLFPFVGEYSEASNTNAAVDIAKAAFKAAEAKDFNQALAFYQKGIAEYPTQPFFYACRSMIHKVLGDEESAFYDYQVAKRMDFNYHTFLEWCENSGAMEEDNDLLEINKRIKSETENAQLYINRAMLLVQHFNYKEAIQDFTKAISLKNNPEILVSMAAVQMRLLHYNHALANLNGVISADDSLISAYVYRAKLYTAVRMYNEALRDFNTAVELSPADTAVLEERAQFFEQTDNFVAAIADYTVIIRQNPDDFYTYVMRADLYEKGNELSLAILDYDKAITLNPYYSDLYQYRGDLRAQLGDGKGAEEDFKKFEELEEDS